MPSTPKLTTIWDALITRMRTINGTGEFWYAVDSSHVAKGTPVDDIVHFPSIYVILRELGLERVTLSHTSQRYVASFDIFGYSESSDHFGAGAKLLRDIVQAMVDDWGLSCDATSIEITGMDLTVEEWKRESGVQVVGLSKVSIDVQFNETFTPSS